MYSSFPIDDTCEDLTAPFILRVTIKAGMNNGGPPHYLDLLFPLPLFPIHAQFMRAQCPLKISFSFCKIYFIVKRQAHSY